ncbi:MAG: ribonuclease III [Lentisphaeria bacterium]|nr:ribonuclease III [Lentisphaeria bacterium]
MDDRSAQVEEVLGYRFRSVGLLCQSLTHPSRSAESTLPEPDNQRLEFLGDAVLQLVATELLYCRFPEMGEGELTKVRSALTNEQALASFAEALGLGEALRLGKGEEQCGGRSRASNLSDAFEAVLGAVYLDGGLAAAEGVVRSLLSDLLGDPATLLLVENPKGALQELTQERFQVLPRYETIRVTGPEHEPCFEVVVLFRGEELARAMAGSRRAAEKQAAEKALSVLQERVHAQ